MHPPPYVPVVASASKPVPSPGRVSLWAPGSAATPPLPPPPLTSHPPPHGVGAFPWGTCGAPPRPVDCWGRRASMGRIVLDRTAHTLLGYTVAMYVRRSWTVLTTVRWGPLVVDEGWGGRPTRPSGRVLAPGAGAGLWGFAGPPPPRRPLGASHACMGGMVLDRAPTTVGFQPILDCLLHGTFGGLRWWVGVGGGIASFGLGLGAQDKCMRY